MAICKQCQKEYSIKETKRVFGDTWWKSSFCSAQCYTVYYLQDDDLYLQADQEMIGNDSFFIDNIGNK